MLQKLGHLETSFDLLVQLLLLILAKRLSDNQIIVHENLFYIVSYLFILGSEGRREHVGEEFEEERKRKLGCWDNHEE